MDERQELIEKYKVANAQHRHQSALMFGQLAVFLAISGGLLNAYEDSELKPYIAIVGMVSAFLFYIIYQRLADFSHSFVKHAKKIELELDFSMHRRSPPTKFKWFTAINASRGMFLFIGIVWLFLLLDYYSYWDRLANFIAG